MSSSTVTPRTGRGAVPLGLVLVAAQTYQIVVFPNLLEALRAEPGWHLSPGGAGLIGSMVFPAMLAGAIAATPLARRLGRRQATLVAVLWSTLWAGACAVAAAPWQMGLFRMLAGIGMGLAIPLILSFAQDAAARDKRALLLVLLGVPVAGIATQLLVSALPVEHAWRLMMALGAVVGAVALALSLWLLPRGTDMSVLTPARAGHRTPTRRIAGWMGIGLIGTDLIAWSTLTGSTAADLRFAVVLNAGVCIVIFAVAGVAVHRSETPTSLSRTVRATVAFILVNPPTVVIILVAVLNTVAGKGLPFVLALFGVWIADSYSRSLTLSVAPRVFEALPRPTVQESGHTAPVPQPLRPGSDG
ncbi:MFS transporter [Streptomyces sp. NPDC101455]|uniref:MFS transporter n=1 Tax=Streptomyces sp. NPDC101455 TaxID=3366142 RepID=UPI00382F6CC8